MSATDITRLEDRIAERIQPQQTGKMQVGQTGLAIKDMSQLLEFAKIMAIGGVSVPKHLRGNPGACIAVCLQAIEWGMSPFAVANKSYSVNDRLAYEAALIHAVLLKRAPIKGRPKFEYLGEGQRRQCRVSARLIDDDMTVDYTSPPIGDIKTQNSPLWKADPDQQLGYFAIRSLARRHFPDTLLGVIEREEARFNAIEGEVVEEVKPAEPEPRRQTVEQRLAELAGDPEPEPLETVYEREEEVEVVEQDQPEALSEMQTALLKAAQKGKRGLRMFMGKLSQDEIDSIPSAFMDRLDKVADYATMKQGE